MLAVWVFKTLFIVMGKSFIAQQSQFEGKIRVRFQSKFILCKSKICKSACERSVSYTSLG